MAAGPNKSHKSQSKLPATVRKCFTNFAGKQRFLCTRKVLILGLKAEKQLQNENHTEDWETRLSSLVLMSIKLILHCLRFHGKRLFAVINHNRFVTNRAKFQLKI